MNDSLSIAVDSEEKEHSMCLNKWRIQRFVLKNMLIIDITNRKADTSEVLMKGKQVLEEMRVYLSNEVNSFLKYEKNRNIS